MAELDNIASELLKSANEADKIYAKTREQSQKDKATRLRVIVQNLKNLTLGASDLNGLSDVAVSSPTNAQVLSYNSTTLKWQNTTISTATPTLDQVTTAGNTTTNAITVGSITSKSGVNNVVNTGNHTGQGYTFRVWDITNGYTLDLNGTGSITQQQRIMFGIGSATGYTEAMRIVSTANVLIGTTTDAGYKLDVNGTARVGSLGLYGNNGTTTAPLIRFNGSNQVNVDPQGYGIVTNHTLITNNYIFSSGGGIRSNDRFAAKSGTSVVSTPFMSYGISRPDGDASINALAGMGGVHDGASWAQGLGLVFYTSNGPDISGGGYLTEKMRITSAGNVGIGTTSPFGKVDVKDGEIFVTTSTNANLRSKLTYQGLYVSRASDGTYPEQIISVSSAWEYHTRNNHVFYRDGSPYFQIGTTGTASYLTINTTGNVLIGTTTDAGYKLDVNGNARVSGDLSAVNGLITFSNPGGNRTMTTSGLTINYGSTYSFSVIGTNTASITPTADLTLKGIYHTQVSTDVYRIQKLTNVGHLQINFDIVGSDATAYNYGTRSGNVRIYPGAETNGNGYGNVILGHDGTNSRGNVGIGTPSPAYKFHISSSAAANIFGTVQATSANGTAAWVAFNDQSDNVVYRVFGSGASGSQMGFSLSRTASLIANLGGSGKFLIGTYSGTDLIFGTSDNARLRLVDSTGNFLVGTMTDYGNKLEVSGTINATAYKINGILGWSGIINIPTIPPISITVNNGIITNVM